MLLFLISKINSIFEYNMHDYLILMIFIKVVYYRVNRFDIKINLWIVLLKKQIIWCRWKHMYLCFYFSTFKNVLKRHIYFKILEKFLKKLCCCRIVCITAFQSKHILCLGRLFRKNMRIRRNPSPEYAIRCYTCLTKF